MTTEPLTKGIVGEALGDEGLPVRVRPAVACDRKLCPLGLHHNPGDFIVVGSHEPALYAEVSSSHFGGLARKCSEVALEQRAETQRNPDNSGRAQCCVV